MSIVRWDPFRTLMRWPSMWDDEDWNISSSTPSHLDVFETGENVVVKANIPGIDEDQVNVTFEKGVLTISAEETEEEADEDKKYYQKASGTYSYRVAVPGNVDLSKDPEAEIKNGVLEIKFVKAEEAKPKQIPIKKK